MSGKCQEISKLFIDDRNLSIIFVLNTKVPLAISFWVDLEISDLYISMIWESLEISLFPSFFDF